MSDPGYHDLPSNGLHLQRRVTDLRTARPMKIKLPGSESCLVLESSLCYALRNWIKPIPEDFHFLEQPLIRGRQVVSKLATWLNHQRQLRILVKTRRRIIPNRIASKPLRRVKVTPFVPLGFCSISGIPKSGRSEMVKVPSLSYFFAFPYQWFFKDCFIPPSSSYLNVL